MSGVDFILTFIFVVYVISSHLRDRSRAAETREFIETIQLMVADMAQLKGLSPHQAAPTVFAETGRSWKAEKVAEKKKDDGPRAQRRAEINRELAKIDRAVAVVRMRAADPMLNDNDKLNDLRKERDELVTELRLLREAEIG